MGINYFFNFVIFLRNENLPVPVTITQRISLRQKLRKQKKKNDIEKPEKNIKRLKLDKDVFTKQPIKNVEKPVHSMKFYFSFFLIWKIFYKFFVYLLSC